MEKVPQGKEDVHGMNTSPCHAGCPGPLFVWREKVPQGKEDAHGMNTSPCHAGSPGLLFAIPTLEQPYVPYTTSVPFTIISAATKDMDG